MPDNTQLSDAERKPDVPSEGADALDSKGEKSSTTTEPEKAEAFDATLVDIGAKAPTEQTRDYQANKQIETWRERIINGEEDVDGNPYSMEHPKLPAWVKRTLDKDPVLGDPARQQVDPDKLKREIAEEMELKQIIDSIPPMPKNKQLEISKEANDLMFQDGKPTGISKVKAWKTALKTAQVELAAYQKGVNRALRSLPPEGEPAKVIPKRDFLSATAKAQAKTLFGLSDIDIEKYSKKILNP